MTTLLIVPRPSTRVTSVAEPQAAQYFPALDGLRAVAFLMVFAEHYLQMPWGWAGVDVFFVLSGFLITGILVDTIDAPHRMRNFYLRRTLRIFPLYYGLILALLLAYPIYHWQWNWTWLAWPLYLGNFARFFVSHGPASPMQAMSDGHLLSATRSWIDLHFGHFWSLCVEEQFYLLWPWLVFSIRDRRKLIYLCLASVAVCPVLRILASYTLPQYMLQAEVLYRATPLRIDALLLGGSIALLRRAVDAERLLTAARVAFAILAPTALIWLGLHGRTSARVYLYPSWRFTWGLTFLDALAACLIVMAIHTGSAAYRIFNLLPLRWIGRISYGAYVFHDIPHSRYLQIVEHLLHRLHLPTSQLKLDTAAVALVCTLIAAWASFRWFETPFIRLKTRWTC